MKVYQTQSKHNILVPRERLLRRSSSVSRSRVSLAASSPLPSLAEQEAVASINGATDRLLLLGNRVAAAAAAAAEINRSTTNDTASLASHSVSIDLSADNAHEGGLCGGGSDSLSLDSHRVYRRSGSHNGLNDPLCVSTPKSSASRSIRRHQHHHPPLRQRVSRERPPGANGAAGDAAAKGERRSTSTGLVEKETARRKSSLDMRSGSSDLSESEKRGTLTSLSSTSTSTASPPSTCSTASPPSSTASPPSR